MVEITVSVPSDQILAFEQTVSKMEGLNIVKRSDQDVSDEREETIEEERERILSGLKEGLEEVRKIRRGELKARPIQELLDEL